MRIYKERSIYFTWAFNLRPRTVGGDVGGVRVSWVRPGTLGHALSSSRAHEERSIVWKPARDGVAWNTRGVARSYSSLELTIRRPSGERALWFKETASMRVMSSDPARRAPVLTGTTRHPTGRLAMVYRAGTQYW